MSERVPWAKKPPKRIRLGDAVAAVAKPIAKALDHLLGTDLTNCGGCAGRRARLNGELPVQSAAPLPQLPGGRESE